MDIDLDQARRRAKELLRAARAASPDALARLRADRAPRLADAQRAIAQDLGFASWPALVGHVDAARGDRDQRRRRLVHAALGGRLDRVEALLEHDPGLARAGFDVALVLGDATAVAAALDRDPRLLEREVSDTGKLPLSCCCHSACLQPLSRRADAVLATIELLLDRGADPNEVHHNAYGAMSVLYGAAGVAHNPAATSLLLERGADPDDGESVYHACEAQDTTCLELLLDAGATVRGTNALGNAIGDVAKVRVLLERGDLRPEDSELRGALLHAVHDEVAEVLIAHGAALDARGRDGLTPYSRAARRGDVSLMALLERAGAATDVDPIAEWLGAVLRGGTRARRMLPGRRSAAAVATATERRGAPADVGQRRRERGRRAPARRRRAARRPGRRRRHGAALRGPVGPAEHGRPAHRARSGGRPDRRAARSARDGARLDRLGVAGRSPAPPIASMATWRRPACSSRPGPA